MTKNKKIVTLLISLLALIVVAAVVVTFFLVPKGNDVNAGNKSQEEKSDGISPGGEKGESDNKDNKNVNNPDATYEPPEKPDVELERDGEDPDIEDYLGGDSKAGLCASMQTLYLNDVQDAMNDSDYGKMKKSTKKAADKGRKIIKKSKGEDKQTKETMNDFMTSIEDFGKYMTDPDATNNEVKNAMNAMFTNEEAAKATCGWGK